MRLHAGNRTTDGTTLPTAPGLVYHAGNRKRPQKVIEKYKIELIKNWRDVEQIECSPPIHV